MGLIDVLLADFPLVEAAAPGEIRLK